jgi:5-methylcytosine-specific restriction endonuclease McrA
MSAVRAGARGKRGSDNPTFIHGRERACVGCGAAFRQPPWLERQNGPQKYCKRSCFHAHGQKRGHEAPDYVGGPKTYRGRGWLEARAKVVADQSGNCADCGVHVGARIAVHHITPFRCFPSAAEANQRSNLVGLCQSCHMRHEAGVSRLHPAQGDIFRDAVA